jgi:NADPH:quinone reductase-like Zn-dependent oxidoreductase
VKAIRYRTRGSADVLVELEVPEPVVGPRDLLVEVQAVSVNPVDYKVRRTNAGSGAGMALTSQCSERPLHDGVGQLGREVDPRLSGLIEEAPRRARQLRSGGKV